MIKRYTVSEIWYATDGWADGRMDGGKKGYIEMGTPPKNKKKDKTDRQIHAKDN